ncbi:MAG: hypothetical protein RJA70_4754, partial [Pseudomonadota bacterium]
MAREESQRPNLIAKSRGKLRWIERFQMGLVRRSYEPGLLADGFQWMQDKFGRHWIHLVTRNLHQLHHLDRVPQLAKSESFILVANHRSFFDLYVVTAELLARGVRQRMVFPVRSNFFYDNPLGLVINGVMSGFAMYPPIFRDRKRAFLNTLAMEELVWLLKQGGHFVGFHPEGTRNTGDPYELLPVRSGIGKIIQNARVPVIPVFINGLLADDIKRQVISNFDGTGTPIHSVFGAPIDYGDLLDQPSTPALHKRIA